MAFCCLCERAVDAWLPYPRAAERSQFMILMETVGSDLSVYGCPHCGCNDRDRHLWLYLLAAGPKVRGSVRVQVDIDPQSFL